MCVGPVPGCFFFRPTQEGIHYLSPKPQLPGQVVMTNLLWELDREVSVGPVVGDTFIHDLIDDVQHIVLQMNTRVTGNKIEQISTEYKTFLKSNFLSVYSDYLMLVNNPSFTSFKKATVSQHLKTID